ncbi:MAG: flavin reductase family protein [Candidatus Aureabacteria bacterium]|nr:flavin reductase family protein [Candidatus Auribacterota bacterium]
MKKRIPLQRAYRLINHGPVVLVSTRYRGRPNVCTAAWVMPLDVDRVAIVISSENYTARCIVATREFVVNIPNRMLAKTVLRCGSVSGSKVDKFNAFGLTPEPARRVKAPLVGECIGHLECRVISGEGRLARKYDLFLARVVAASAERGLFTDRWNVRLPRARTLHHLGGNIFAVPAGRIVK